MPLTRKPRSNLVKAALAISASAAAAGVHAQSIQQPTSNDTFTAFSGQGAVPFRFIPSSSSVSSINLAVSFGDAGDQYAIANGLQSSSGSNGGDISAVFAPIGGWCGDVGELFRMLVGSAPLAGHVPASIFSIAYLADFLL